MVFTNKIKNNNFYENNSINYKILNKEIEELNNNPSFALVTLFFKYIKEDFYNFGSLSVFKSYFEENSKEYLSYLLNLQEIKNTMINNKYISSELLNKIKIFANKLDEMKKNNICEESEEFKNNLKNYNNYKEKIEKYTPDLKSNLSNYDNFGQKNDLTNLDEIDKLCPNLIFDFFDEEDEEDEEDETEPEGSDRISSYLLKYTHAIYASIKDLNVTIETSYCHDQLKLNFLNYLEKDLNFYSLTNQKKFYYYYYIQEVSNKKNTYGLFIYSNMNKIQFAFYDPKIGIKEFNYNEYSKFKNQFSKLISNYGKNYTSFRLKIDSSTKKITPKNIMNLEGLLTLLSQSSNNYIDYINNSKCFILIGSKKEDYNFCKSILASQKTDLSHESIGNEFFIKYTNYIHKVRKNPNDLQEKSFWIFYLINYLAYNTELARAELNTLEPFLGKEKIFDIVIDYFNQKNNSLKWNTKKVISLILIEVYKNMSTYDFRIPFYNDTKQFKLNHTQNKIGKFLLESFDLDPKTTITDWNRQGFVYNDRFISKRFDGTYETFIGYNDINKDMSLKEYQNNVSNEILEKHFLKSTENKDIKFAKLCLGVCNQTHVFGIGNLLTAYFNEKYSEIINFKYKYIFIKKICENIYDFMILYYIEDITLPKKEITQKFKSPIYFNYTFSIEIKDQDYIAKNFNMGFLNKTLENNSSNNFKQKILAAMQDDMIIQFYKKSKKNVISYIYMS